MQFPPLQPVVKILLLINIGIFALDSFLHLNLSDWLGLKYLGADTFLPTQLVSYMFLHGSWGHLFGNMLGLFFLGNTVEMVLGSKRFLTFYLVCGIGAGLIYSGVRYFETQQILQAAQNFMDNPSFEFLLSFDRLTNFPEFEINDLGDAGPQAYLAKYSADVQTICYIVENYPCVGASGAVFGLIAGLALLMPDREIMIFPLPIPLKMKYFAAIYFLVELKTGIFPTPGDNIAHFAHIGGAVIAFLYLKYWEKVRKMFS